MENNTPDTQTPSVKEQQNPQKPSVAAQAGKAAAGVAAGVATGVAKSVGMIAVKVLLAAAVVAGIGFGTKKAIEANKIKILDTPTVVTEIRKISELNTYKYIEEFVIRGEKAVEKKDLLGFIKKESAPDSTHHEIVMITRGVVRAGYDLSKLSESDLAISGDSLAVRLPATEIFDVIINPSDNQVFVEEGSWTHEEITALQVDCRNKLHQNALDRGILKKADEIGQKKVESLFKSLGFRAVTVIPCEDK